jgi:hypothetical protein
MGKFVNFFWGVKTSNVKFSEVKKKTSQFQFQLVFSINFTKLVIKKREKLA